MKVTTLWTRDPLTAAARNDTAGVLSQNVAAARLVDRPCGEHTVGEYLSSSILANLARIADELTTRCSVCES